MIIDVLRGVPLGVPEQDAVVALPKPEPPPNVVFPTRNLELRGEPVFRAGSWCGTCPATFTKVKEPPQADIGVVNEHLNSGIDAVTYDVLNAYGALLARSTYTVALLDISPRLVSPGGPADYFTHEVVSSWGVFTSFTASGQAVSSAQDPRTPYYRTFASPVSATQHLYELVVPMVPPSWNDAKRVAAYQQGSGPVAGTAVAYSLLDIVESYDEFGEDDYQHWVLTHFLLDGHHKVEAAAASGRPVRLLTLLDERRSMSRSYDITTMLTARAQPPQPRVPLATTVVWD